VIEKENKYTAMQLKQYNEEAEKWQLDNRDPVIGNWEQNNNRDDYDLLFDGIDISTKVGLDFGCGPGRNLVRFGKDFRRLDGVDISPICLEKAKEHLRGEGFEPNDRNLYLCNGVDLAEIPSDTYDVVMSVITLQHICVREIRFNYMCEFHRVLKQGGILTAQMGFGKRDGGHDYYANSYDATGTNGWDDVMVTDPDQLARDLHMIGFNEFTFQIVPPGGGDVHDNWIYFRATK
jgi:SAM-dependent methyltransferase